MTSVVVGVVVVVSVVGIVVSVEPVILDMIMMI